jgi:hypothetical protein
MVRQFIDLINRYVPGGMLLLSSLPIFNTNLWNYTEINPQSIHSDLPARNQTLIVDDIRNICAQDALVIPEFAGIVIDDLSQQFSQRGPERYWHAEEQGFENHFWWTHNNRSGTDNLGLWSLGISQAGTYEIFVYIPPAHATTTNAVYIIAHNDEQDRVTVNQAVNRNSWYKLGAFSFSGTGEEYIQLSDETGEEDTKFEIAFDAVGYRSVDSSWEEEVSDALWDKVRPWLDEKTASLEQALKEWLNEQKGKFLQKMADSLKNWIDQQCAGLGAAMLLPFFALIFWHKQRGKTPKSKE